MHSKIYQISSEPITNHINKEEFNNCDWLDYVGDELEDDERLDCIKRFFEDYFGGMFSVDGDAITFNGLGDFISQWNKAIRDKALELTDDKVDGRALYQISKIAKCTHLYTDSRFYIEDWNGYAAECGDFIEYLDKRFKKGDRIYVGAIIDYHF